MYGPHEYEEEQKTKHGTDSINSAGILEAFNTMNPAKHSTNP